MATGAAIAGGGERRVISLQADGSAMYSLQSLWTQARERLPCTTILLSNRKYEILIGEYRNVGATPGDTAMSMLDLGNPDLDWVKLANGMGVEAARATTLDAVRRPADPELQAARPFPDRADDLTGPRRIAFAVPRSSPGDLDGLVEGWAGRWFRAALCGSGDLAGDELSEVEWALIAPMSTWLASCSARPWQPAFGVTCPRANGG